MVPPKGNLVALRGRREAQVAYSKQSIRCIGRHTCRRNVESIILLFRSKCERLHTTSHYTFDLAINMNDLGNALVPFPLHPAGFIDCFMRLGADLDQLLVATGFSSADYTKGIGYCNLNQLANLIKSGMDQCDHTDAGFRIAAIFPWCYYGDLAGVIETSPSMREAGAAFRRYTAIAHPHLKRFLAHINFYFESTNRLVVPIASAYDNSVPRYLNDFDHEFRTGIICRLASSCGDRKKSENLRLHLKRTQHLPEQVISAIGADSVVYGTNENAISAPYGFFENEWRNIRRPLFNRVIARCENAYQAAGLCDSITDAVRWHVDNRFIRDVELEPIADIMNTSPRSLSRKLATEGTCFREIVMQARMNLALRHVVHSRLSIDDMAALIGFSTSSSFMRSVKARTGLTVNELRSLPPADAESLFCSAQQTLNRQTADADQQNPDSSNRHP